MSELFRNKYRTQTVRLPGYNYGDPGWYFVTICTQDRVCYFGNIIEGQMVLSEMGKIVHDEWLKTAEMRNNVELDEFIVMPNHLHGIVIIKDMEPIDILKNKNASTVETHGNASLRGTTQMEKPKNISIASQLPPTPTQFQKPTFHYKPYKNRFGPQHNNLASIVRGFKGTVTKQINTKYNKKYFTWQSGYYEHIIKSEQALNNIERYIIENPTKWWRDRNNLAGLKM